MGHAVEAVWSYTPRQISGMMFVAIKRRKRLQAERLSINTMASRGEPRAVRKQVKEWQQG